MPNYLQLNGTNERAESQSNTFNSVDTYNKLYFEIELESVGGDVYAPFSNLLDISNIAVIQYRSFVGDSSKLRIITRTTGGTRTANVFANGLPSSTKFTLGLLFENSASNTVITTFVDGVEDTTMTVSGNLRYFPRNLNINPNGGFPLNIYTARLEFDDVEVFSWTPATAPASGTSWPSDAGSIDLNTPDDWTFYAGGSTPAPVIDIVVIQSEQVNESQSLDFATFQNIEISTSEQLNQSASLNVNQVSIQGVVVLDSQQLNQTSSAEVQVVQSSASISSEQVNQSAVQSISILASINSISSQQLNQSTTLEILTNGVQGIHLAFSEQVNQSSTIVIGHTLNIAALDSQQVNETNTLNVSTGAIQNIEVLVSEQLNETLVLDLSAAMAVGGIASQQLNETYNAIVQAVQQTDLVATQQINQSNTVTITLNSDELPQVPVRLISGKLINRLITGQMVIKVIDGKII